MTTTTKLERVGSGESTVIDPPENVGLEAESKKLPSSQYKGVVPQPNGRWGAQIYEKHQRVWLGTFNQESDAAKAYDVAAQRFRGRDAVTNFKPLSKSDEADLLELEFLKSHSKAEIVDMLRKHTYGDELLQKKHTMNSQHANSSRFTQPSPSEKAAVNSKREHLFEKTVTPSDVGKLNRLVIPKQHAEKHFPLPNICTGAGEKGVLLNFEDEMGKVWRFRYSYWNSSQSYVLTKGWSRFVKEKSLQAGDVVGFQQYYLNEDRNDQKQLYIGCKPRAKPIQVVRLFGVNIFKADGLENGWNNNDDSMNFDGKKKRSSSDCTGDPNLGMFLKKQCVGAL